MLKPVVTYLLRHFVHSFDSSHRSNYRTFFVAQQQQKEMQALGIQSIPYFKFAVCIRFAISLRFVKWKKRMTIIDTFFCDEHFMTVSRFYKPDKPQSNITLTN